MERHVNSIGLSTQGNMRKGVDLFVFGSHLKPTDAFVHRKPPSCISIIGKTIQIICLKQCDEVEDFERTCQHVSPGAISYFSVDYMLIIC